MGGEKSALNLCRLFALNFLEKWKLSSNSESIPILTISQMSLHVGRSKHNCFHVLIENLSLSLFSCLHPSSSCTLFNLLSLLLRVINFMRHTPSILNLVINCSGFVCRLLTLYLPSALDNRCYCAGCVSHCRLQCVVCAFN